MCRDVTLVQGSLRYNFQVVAAHCGDRYAAR